MLGNTIQPLPLPEALFHCWLQPEAWTPASLLLVQGLSNLGTTLKLPGELLEENSKTGCLPGQPLGGAEPRQVMFGGASI